MSLPPDRVASVISGFLGIAGTIFLFFGSYAYEPLAGGVLWSDSVKKFNAGVDARNEVRGLRQRVGLCLLGLSFLIQIAGAFFF